MSSSTSSQGGNPKIEFLPETLAEANELDEALRREIAGMVVDLAHDANLGEALTDHPIPILEGCRKLRFDRPNWHGKPRYRLVYRNEPADGSVANVCVLAIGRRDRLIAYAKASARLKKRIAEEGLSGG